MVQTAIGQKCKSRFFDYNESEILIFNPVTRHSISLSLSLVHCLSYRRLTRCSCCYLLYSISGTYSLLRWQMPIQLSLLTCSCWREVSASNTRLQQYKWNTSQHYCQCLVARFRPHNLFDIFWQTNRRGGEIASIRTLPHCLHQCLLSFSVSLIMQTLCVPLWPLTLVRW